LPPGDVAIFCAEHAEPIRLLGKRVGGDIVEIGNRLIAVREQIPGRLEVWLHEEFDWSRPTAYRFISVAEAFGRVSHGETLEIDAGALYLLAGPTVSAEVREAAVDGAAIR